MSGKHNLTVLYYNARSLPPKIDYLIANCEIYKPDIICITESWLSSDILNCEIAIPNFNIVRRDRNRNGGGVTVYIKDCFEFKIISHGPLDLEFLALSVHNGNIKICVCLLYRPPSSSTTFFDNLYSTFVNLNVSLFSHVLVFDDFNVDFLNVNHPLFSNLCNILDSFSFVQLVSQPTRVTSNGSATLIDLVLSSSPDHVQDCTVIPPLDTSDHRGILATINGIFQSKQNPVIQETSGNTLWLTLTRPMNYYPKWTWQVIWMKLKMFRLHGQNFKLQRLLESH